MRACAQLLSVLAMVVGLSSVGAAQPLTVAVAGDIACGPHSQVTKDSCQMAATADLIIRKHVAAVLAVGDLQYPQGGSSDFADSYAKSWGRFKSVTYPVPGNHEYFLYDAEGYYRYFGDAAHPDTRGYYSFDLDDWHVIALNSNCFWVGGCGDGSAQLAWLKRDLRAHRTRCTLAFWHHPRFSSGPHGSSETYQPFWEALAEARADIVVNAHDHLYERFAPLRADGTPSPGGLQAFVVGTGGRDLTDADSRQPHSAALIQGSFGVLFLELDAGAYTWTFETTAGQTVDEGTRLCH